MMEEKEEFPMNREQILKTQPRCYMQGTITYMNNEWVFFDDEDDEAYLLSEVADEEIELFISHTWVQGVLVEDGIVLINNQLQPLQKSACIRIHKPLQESYGAFLQELCDEAFLQFTNTLKELHYSIYDCMLCHNFLSFQPEDSPSVGVNFFIFDNGDMVCSIHHHFIRGLGIAHDRFEFLQADGLTVECK